MVAMIRKYEQFVAELIRLMDIFFIFLSFHLAYQARFSEWFVEASAKRLSWLYIKPALLVNPAEHDFENILFVIAPVWLFMLAFTNAYEFVRTGSFFTIIKTLFKVHVAGSMAVLSLVFLTEVVDYNRSLFAIFVVINFTLASLLRYAAVNVLWRTRVSGRNRSRAIIVGNGEKALRALVELNSNRHWGFAIDGVITEKPTAEERLLGLKVLGSMADMERILRRTPADDVFVAVDEGRYVELKEILKVCENIGISVHLLPDKYDLEIAKSTVGSLGAMEFVTFFTVRDNPAQRFAKRALDIAVSALLLPLLAAVYAVAGVLIKLDSDGPVIYKSVRLTHNRRPFVFYKFRTMVKGAEEKFEMVSANNALEGPIAKIPDDSRVTRVGRFLRKYSVDELPQIVNVILGDMSLVGPRPPLPEEVELYTLPQLRKLSMPQGITGLWQVSGRDAVVRFEDRLKMDLEYIDNWSLWLDTKILFKTLFVVFKGAL